MSKGFYQFHIGGELSACKEFPDALCSILPCEHLSGQDMLRHIARCKADTFIRIPCADALAIHLEPIAAMIEFLEKGCVFFHGFPLGELGGDAYTVVVGIAAKAQNMVDFLLCKRKSEGRKGYALRCCFDIGSLFFLGWEQAQLDWFV